MTVPVWYADELSITLQSLLLLLDECLPLMEPVRSGWILDDIWDLTRYNKNMLNMERNVLTYELYIFSGWVAVICQREAVKLCPQSSAPSPPVWQSWTWITTTCRIQEWSCSLLDWRVQVVDWRPSGQNSLTSEAQSITRNYKLLSWQETTQINCCYVVVLLTLYLPLKRFSINQSFHCDTVGGAVTYVV